MDGPEKEEKASVGWRKSRETDGSAPVYDTKWEPPPADEADTDDDGAPIFPLVRIRI